MTEKGERRYYRKINRMIYHNWTRKEAGHGGKSV